MNVSTKDEQSSLSETADQAIAEDDATYVSREFLLGDLIKSVTRRFTNGASSTLELRFR